MGITKREKRKTIVDIILILIAIIAYIIIAGNISLNKMAEKNPDIIQKIKEKDIGYLYSFYIISEPSVEAENYYGNPNASITLIAFLDMNSEDSRRFTQEIFPIIKEEFINTGKIKYYHNNYITLEDIKEENNRYIYAKALECIKVLKPKEYYNFYFDLMNSSQVKNLNILAKKYKINNTQFIECMDNMKFDEISQDAIESENLDSGVGQKFFIGIEGKDNTILSGIPSIERFRRDIKSYQLIIGD